MFVADIETPMIYVSQDRRFAIMALDIQKYPDPTTAFRHGYAQLTWRWVRNPHMSDLAQAEIRTQQFSLREPFRYTADRYMIEELP